MGYEIAWESRGAYKRYFGHVTDAELMQSVIDIESDHRFDNMRYVINDFLDVVAFQISRKKIEEISAIDGAAALSNPNIKIAVVATDVQIRELAEVYANSTLKSYPTRIFTTVAEARAWL